MKSIARFAMLAVLLSAPAMAQHSVTLHWSQPSNAKFTGNTVYRGTTSGGPYTVLFNSPKVIATFTDLTVNPGVTYFYVVSITCNSCSPSNGPISNEVPASIPLSTVNLPPPAPAGLFASGIK